MNDQTQERIPATAERPSLASFQSASDPRALMASVISNAVATNFDADAWVVMDERDSRMIEQELMFGARSDKFVYDFSIAGTRVAGISVIGAAELASHYGGIQHRLVSSWRKVGALFIFTQYPGPDTSMDVITKTLPDLANEPDGYNCVVEVKDIKTGNAVQTEKFEAEFELKSGGQEWFRKPHFATIAQSKAYRNGVLRVIPQAIQMRWREEQLRSGKNQPIGEGVLDQKRSGVLQYAAAQGIAVDRGAVERLTFEQIAGVAEAARTKDRALFVGALVALGVIPADGSAEGGRPMLTSSGGSGGGTPSTTGGTGTAGPGGTARQTRKPPVRQQQSVQREAGNPADRGAASETRQDEPAGQGGISPPADQKPSEQAQTGGNGQSGSDAPFEVYILDEHGELMDQTPYRDPLAFLSALAGYARDELTPALVLPLLEHNADGIGDALAAALAIGPEADRQARDLQHELSALLPRDDADQPAAEIAIIAAPEGRESWGGYVDRFRQAERGLAGADYLAWDAAQEPVFAKAPRSIVAAIRKVIAEGCGRHGIAPPVVAAGGDRDEAAVQAAIDALGQYHTVNDVQLYSRSGIPKALYDRLGHEGKTALVDKLKAAFEKRIAELQARA